MKKVASFIFLVFSIFISNFARSDVLKFENFFIDKTMRIDYFHSGDAQDEWVSLDKVYQQGIWAGSMHNLIYPFNNGHYFIKIYDAKSRSLIYSKGFNSYFGEYKTTDFAKKGIKRTFHETAIIPYPKEKICFTIEYRGKNNDLKSLFNTEINPNGIGIIKESLMNGVKVWEINKKGDPHKKVDLVFVGEGFRIEEQDKFRKTVERLCQIFFEHAPYNRFKESFNVYAVCKPSQESGTDEPGLGVFKNTSISSSFNSLGLSRYLLTEDNKSLRDIIAHVPYDTIAIVVNSKRYGGGGIYNFYSVFTTNEKFSEYLFLHEFGHSFGGLADEYYSSSVTYTDFYPKGIEPLEPNITALLDPENLKWKYLVTKGVKIPTPWGKEKLDKMSQEFSKDLHTLYNKINLLKNKNASKKKIEKLQDRVILLLKKLRIKRENFFKNNKYKDKVGAFEGAGYSPKGLFRPMLDCIMFSTRTTSYCKICEKAIERVIKYYSY